MNPAWGYELFAQHSEVESSSFLVDDCIYLMADVSTAGATVE